MCVRCWNRLGEPIAANLKLRDASNNVDFAVLRYEVFDTKTLRIQIH